MESNSITRGSRGEKESFYSEYHIETEYVLQYRPCHDVSVSLSVRPCHVVSLSAAVLSRSLS